MTDKLPADWAIDKAVELLREAGIPIILRAVKSNPDSYRSTIAFARYIEEHEEPPVDPVLLAAREWVEAGLTGFEVGVLKGNFDYSTAVQAFIAGAKWQAEQPQ